MATSAGQLIVVAAPVHRAFIGVLFSCWAVALLFENHLLTCLWQLYSHLPNDLGILTTLFGLSSSKQHLGLAVFPSLPFFMSYTRLLYLHFISLSLSILFPHRHSALWQTAWWVKLPQWRFQSTVTVTQGHYQRTTALNRWVLSTVSVDSLLCATFTQGKAITHENKRGDIYPHAISRQKIIYIHKTKLQQTEECTKLFIFLFNNLSIIEVIFIPYKTKLVILLDHCWPITAVSWYGDCCIIVFLRSDDEYLFIVIVDFGYLLVLAFVFTVSFCVVFFLASWCKYVVLLLTDKSMPSVVEVDIVVLGIVLICHKICYFNTIHPIAPLCGNTYSAI